MKQIHWNKYDGGVWGWKNWTIVMRHCHGRPTFWIKHLHDFVWPAASLAKAKEWVKENLTTAQSTPHLPSASLEIPSAQDTV